MVDAEPCGDLAIRSGRVAAQLVSHELPPLFLREMPAQQIDAAGVRQLLGFAQAGADHDRVIVDAKFVSINVGFRHVRGDRDCAGAPEYAHASFVIATIIPISTNTTIATCVQIQNGDMTTRQPTSTAGPLPPPPMALTTKV